MIKIKIKDLWHGRRQSDGEKKIDRLDREQDGKRQTDRQTDREAAGPKKDR
jgi:hypothetical protein